jgi:hypothetical protein
MGVCCNTADQDTTTECEVPGGKPGTTSQNQKQLKGKSVLEQFQYQQLEIFQPQNNNKCVMDIIDQLQPFDWAIQEVDDGQREIKPICVLENGAVYQGEWLATAGGE